MYSEEPLQLEHFEGEAVKDDYIHIDAVTDYVKDLIQKEIKTNNNDPQLPKVDENYIHKSRLSKYILKTELPAQEKCPDLKDYIHKNKIPAQEKCPDLTDYMKKTEIKPHEKCPDLTEYLRKTEIKPCQLPMMNKKIVKKAPVIDKKIIVKREPIIESKRVYNRNGKRTVKRNTVDRKLKVHTVKMEHKPRQIQQMKNVITHPVDSYSQQIYINPPSKEQDYQIIQHTNPNENQQEPQAIDASIHNMHNKKGNRGMYHYQIIHNI